MGSQVQSYDYIICGGGTAGCVLASRLAEANFSVLLVEAGGPAESVPASKIPAALAEVLGTEADWNIYSEPSKGLTGRGHHLGRGKFVGGSSGSNGALCIRGPRASYDAWGIEGWSGEDMHKYMSKAEDFRTKCWFQPEKSAHGYEGPLKIAPHDNAPISDRVLESYQSQGLPLVPDMFTTGDVPHGCGHVVRSIYDGLRTTSADYIHGERKSERITVKTHTFVDKVVLNNANGKLRATGIIAVATIGRDKAIIEYSANKEIILTSGAYGTPAILLRSGIGPESEIEKHGIKQQLELPGVGKNLQDHLVLLSFYEVSKPGITNDYLIWHGGAKDRSIEQWKKDRTGFMSQFPFGSFAYARLDERLSDSPLWKKAKEECSEGQDPMGSVAEPHVEFWNSECYAPKYLFTDFPSDDKHAFAMAVELFNPRSRGHVTIPSTDPTANPVVDHNWLDDPLDILVFSEACRFANEVAVAGKGTKDIISGSWPAHLAHHAFTQREEWEKEIRDRADTCEFSKCVDASMLTSPGYHPAGTAKMGTGSDAVVDARLRVHCVDGLRVVDASIFPKLIAGHPQMAVYGTAEKAADMIKADAN